MYKMLDIHGYLDYGELERKGIVEIRREGINQLMYPIWTIPETSTWNCFTEGQCEEN